MSDQDAAVEETATTDEQAAPEAAAGESEDWRSNFDADIAADRIRKLQSEAKNLRERAKTAEEAAKGVPEKDQRISTLEAELLRERVGRRLALPDELVDRLRGGTEEEILADAEKLVSIVGRSTKPNSARPTEALRGGSEPDTDPEPDLSKIAAEIPRR